MYEREEGGWTNNVVCGRVCAGASVRQRARFAGCERLRGFAVVHVGMKILRRRQAGARRDAAGAQETLVVSVLRGESELAGRCYEGLQQ